MDTEQAQFTRELFLLLGLIKPPAILNGRIINPLTPGAAEDKRDQHHKDQDNPGCIFQAESGKWTFRVAYKRVRLRKGGFPDEAAARQDMLRWLREQKALRTKG